MSTLSSPISLTWSQLQITIVNNYNNRQIRLVVYKLKSFPTSIGINEKWIYNSENDRLNTECSNRIESRQLADEGESDWLSEWLVRAKGAAHRNRSGVWAIGHYSQRYPRSLENINIWCDLSEVCEPFVPLNWFHLNLCIACCVMLCIALYFRFIRNMQNC